MIKSTEAKEKYKFQYLCSVWPGGCASRAPGGALHQGMVRLVLEA